MRINIFRKKTVVVIYASIGSGHQKAAEAISEAIYLLSPKIRVEQIDVLNFSKSEFLKSIPSKIDLGSKIVNLIYDYLWGKKDIGFLTQRAVKLIKENFDKLEKYLLKTKPATIVTTHVLASLLVSEYKKSRNLLSPHFSILTDFRSNQVWPINNVDHYFVPTIPALMDLVKTGINSDKITISGIPLRNQFLIEKEKKTEDDRKSKILFIVGGEKSASYKNIVNTSINTIKKILPITTQLTVVCGNNFKFKRQIEKKLSKHINAKSLTIIGFEKNMANLINKHNLVLTKSGGLISAEAIFLNKPIIILGESYGQEKANAVFLTNSGLAIQVKNTKELLFVLKIIYKQDIYSQIANGYTNQFKTPASMLIARQIMQKLDSEF